MQIDDSYLVVIVFALCTQRQEIHQHGKLAYIVTRENSSKTRLTTKSSYIPPHQGGGPTCCTTPTQTHASVQEKLGIYERVCEHTCVEGAYPNAINPNISIKVITYDHIRAIVFFIKIILSMQIIEFFMKKFKIKQVSCAYAHGLLSASRKTNIYTNIF